MKLGTCPCCDSRSLQKLGGERFICVDCNAPLRFTWGPAHLIGLFLPVFLPNLLSGFTDAVRYGIPALLFVLLIVLYFRYRRFYVDDIGVAEAINACNTDLSHINRFVAGKIGALDFIDKVNSLKNRFTSSPEMKALISDHFNRVGGLSTDEQTNGFAKIHPGIDLMAIALNRRVEIQAEIERLKTYHISA